MNIFGEEAVEKVKKLLNGKKKNPTVKNTTVQTEFPGEKSCWTVSIFYSPTAQVSLPVRSCSSRTIWAF